MNYLEQILKNRCANIAYPVELHETMELANKHWVAFCAIDTKTKTELTFSNYGGYELKQDPSAHDVKENIHYSQSKRQHFLDFAENIGAEDALIVRSLVETTDKVIDMSEQLIIDFLTDVESGLGKNNLLQSILNYKDHWVVRYLHYFPVETDRPHTAAPHCDIGGFTLHLFQDYPGLEYYDGNQWNDIPLEKGNTSIFPGIQMQHRTQGEIISTCHRVVPTPDSARTGRYSAVLFTNWPDGGNWDKERCGKLSNQEPGFNYQMTHEELDTYFDTSATLEDK